MNQEHDALLSALPTWRRGGLSVTRKVREPKLLFGRSHSNPNLIAESVGNGRWRWVPPSEVSSEPNYASTRPSRTHSEVSLRASSDFDEAAKHLGYKPNQIRRQKPNSQLDNMIPADWKAFVTPMPPKQQQPKSDDKDLPEETCTERCRITTSKDIRVLTFKPGGERLIVRRWRAGHNMSKQRQRHRHSSDYRTVPFQTADGPQMSEAFRPNEIAPNEEFADEAVGQFDVK
mmetsp:Transcript_4082/g.6597  ORF Transcript_4082/g.6597 Transcript_4082/m.6597 type:complete len:231 (-) Transcript_4082:111-803(-)